MVTLNGRTETHATRSGVSGNCGPHPPRDSEPAAPRSPHRGRDRGEFSHEPAGNFQAPSLAEIRGPGGYAAGGNGACLRIECEAPACGQRVAAGLRSVLETESLRSLGLCGRGRKRQLREGGGTIDKEIANKD